MCMGWVQRRRRGGRMRRDVHKLGAQGWYGHSSCCLPQHTKHDLPLPPLLSHTPTHTQSPSGGPLRLHTRAATVFMQILSFLLKEERLESTHMPLYQHPDPSHDDPPQGFRRRVGRWRHIAN